MTPMRATENILGANHDLWAINTEPEYHEERRETPCAAGTGHLLGLGRLARRDDVVEDPEQDAACCTSPVRCPISSPVSCGEDKPTHIQSSLDSYNSGAPP